MTDTHSRKGPKLHILAFMYSHACPYASPKLHNHNKLLSVVTSTFKPPPPTGRTRYICKVTLLSWAHSEWTLDKLVQPYLAFKATACKAHKATKKSQRQRKGNGKVQITLIIMGNSKPISPFSGCLSSSYKRMSIPTKDREKGIGKERESEQQFSKYLCCPCEKSGTV